MVNGKIPCYAVNTKMLHVMYLENVKSANKEKPQSENMASYSQSIGEKKKRAYFYIHVLVNLKKVVTSNNYRK